MKIIDELDQVLEQLKSSGAEIKGNVTKLKDEIVNLESNIEKDETSSLNSVKEELSNLKKVVTDANNKIDSMDINEEKERTELRFGYYFTLVNMRSELMNFDINNIDDLLNSFDTYDNEKKTIFQNLKVIIENTIKSNTKAFSDLNDIIALTLSDYRDILLKHQKRLFSFFASLKQKITELTKIYLLLFDEYHKELNDLSASYKTRKESLLAKYPRPAQAFSEKGASLQKNEADNFNNLYNILVDEYTAKQDQNYQLFSTEADALIKEMERMLSLILTDDENLLNNRSIALRQLINRYQESGGKDKTLIFKIEKAVDRNEQAAAITFAFKKLKGDLYNKFLEKEKHLESEFLKKRQELNEKALLSKYLTKENIESSYLEQEIYMHNVYQELDVLLYNITDKKLDLTFKFMVNQEKIVNAFLKLKLRYNYEKDYIGLSLKNELENQSSSLKRQIKSMKAQNEYETALYQNTYIEIDKQSKKSLAILEYQMKITSLHRKFITAKAISKMSYELYQTEKEMDFLKPRYALDKILTEYDAAKTSFEAVYNSEILLLESSKKRNELSNISNYEYAMSLIKHRVLVATQMMDLAKTEYQLRVNVLNEIRETSKEYSSNRIEHVIAAYLDKIEEINEIKKIRLSSILQMIELHGQNLEQKDTNIAKTSEILDEVNNAIIEIEGLIKNDPSIIYQEENIERMDYVIVEGMDKAQKIRNQTLVEAVKSLKVIDEESSFLINSLNESSPSIDYISAYNAYKLAYLDELARLDNQLDKDSKPLIEELNRIAFYYNSDRYIKDFKELDNKHKELVNQYYLELLDKLQEIEKDHYYDPNTVTIMNENLAENLYSYVEESKQEIGFNHQKMENKVAALKENFAKDIDDIDKSLIKNIEAISDAVKIQRKGFYDVLNSLIDERNSLFKEINKVQKKARKDYALEFEAISHDLDDKIKEIEKDIKKKYSNPTVYTLKGKENK